MPCKKTKKQKSESIKPKLQLILFIMNIFITGASQGIGRELVKKLAKENHRIIALSRNEEKLESLVRDCKALNKVSKLETIPFDLRDLKSNTHFIVQRTEETFSNLDILINNAGFLTTEPFSQISDEILSKTMEINFFAPFILIQQLLPLLRKSKNAHIVNIGSMGGINGSSKFSGLSAYSSSKGALAILSECLAEELEEDQISCNYLALGAVQTEMLSNAFPGYEAPLNPKEMAEFIADFALNGNRYFNGKILPVSVSTP